jgi:hypothetical protein
MVVLARSCHAEVIWIENGACLLRRNPREELRVIIVAALCIAKGHVSEEDPGDDKGATVRFRVAS